MTSMPSSARARKMISSWREAARRPQCVGDVLAGQIALLAALGKQLIEGRFCQSRLRRDINNIGHRHCLTP